MKILLVKLGALGDVLRTTPLLTALKKKFPQSEITWVVDPAHADILSDNTKIDRLWSYSKQTVLNLKKNEFDWAINLDKEEEALDCMAAAKAGKRSGFARAADGTLQAADPLSDYALRLGIDDELKFRQNKKSYQQISFEQLGFEFAGEDYVFSLDKPSIRHADDLFAARGIDLSKNQGPVIGLNTGSGRRFAGKKLPVTTYADLARKFCDQMNATVLLLGGEDEIQRNTQIEQMSLRPVVNTGSHSIRQFAALVKRCDLVVSGDTTAMHIAVAMKVPVVAHFASTCAAEIELYGRGMKIVSAISCAPCYKRICPIDEQCTKDMSADEIFTAAKTYLQKNPTRR